MLIMPILNKNRNGVLKIYNILVYYKNSSKVKEAILLKDYSAEDIIINGISFNNSLYNTSHYDPSKITDFLRYFNSKNAKKDFLVTTKEDPESKLYDLYNVVVPPRKISKGLDNLYGSTILDIRHETPNRQKGRYLSLKELGVDKHITDLKLYKLKEIVEQEKDPKRQFELMQLNGVSDLKNTIDFMKNFEFTIISEATMTDDDFKCILDSFNALNTKDTKNLTRYYTIAQENQEVYNKLTNISKILYKKPINLIKSKSEPKILVKTMEDNKNAA